MGKVAVAFVVACAGVNGWREPLAVSEVGIVGRPEGAGLAGWLVHLEFSSFASHWLASTTAVKGSGQRMSSLFRSQTALASSSFTIQVSPMRSGLRPRRIITSKALRARAAWSQSCSLSKMPITSKWLHKMNFARSARNAFSGRNPHLCDRCPRCRRQLARVEAHFSPSFATRMEFHISVAAFLPILGGVSSPHSQSAPHAVPY